MGNIVYIKLDKLIVKEPKADSKVKRTRDISESLKNSPKLPRPCQGTFHRGYVKGLAADIKNGKNRIYCNNCEDEGSEDEDQDEELQDYSKILKDIQKKVGAIPRLKTQLDSITQSLIMLSDKYESLIVEHEQSKEKIYKLEKAIKKHHPERVLVIEIVSKSVKK
ncbi:unnamed protein product [Leptidea sinapis]|uniref:Uncharacterized protein n=1 Tax=Leptidea sinapis TaxID=189913 RepID=A0A5E4QSK4_9NEOP|nr:unnamed protein product [Leptidea sinapis]